MKYIANIDYMNDFGRNDTLEYELVLNGEDTRLSDREATLTTEDGVTGHFVSLEAAFKALSGTHDEVHTYKGSYARWYNDLLENAIEQHASYTQELSNETERGR